MALFLLALQFATPSAGAPIEPRVELLATWIQAADAHAPNTVDPPLQLARALSGDDFAHVMQDPRSCEGIKYNARVPDCRL